MTKFFLLYPVCVGGILVLVLLACAAGAVCFAVRTRRFPAPPLHRQLREWLCVGALTLCYAIAALLDLGARTAPQTFYQTTLPNEQFLLSFEEPVTIREIWSYSGIGDAEPSGKSFRSDFSVLALLNGNTVYITSIRHDCVFTWVKQQTEIRADSLLIVGAAPGQVLYELVLVDADGKLLSPELSQAEDVSPLCVLDEQDTLPPENSYFFSMYFDEVYHGRSAYEILHGLSVYETTHPPLGKELIALGIALFGMTPFGWRISGVLAGIAMVPVLYLLAKELLRSKEAAFLAAFLLAVDFMHITQTRIGLVDSFLVLFILLMFLFMAKYAAIPLEQEQKKQRLYLLLSGIALGAAISIKWNGAFAAAGLAIWFFGTLWAKYCRYVSKSPTRRRQARLLAGRTLLWCVFAFVFVPALVYFITFLPVLDRDAPGTVFDSFAAWQIRMFSYHSELTAQHAYASPWYTWPILRKPVWYAVSTVGDRFSRIVTQGNPLVWLPIPACIVYTVWKGSKQKNLSALAIAAGYLCAFVPWAFISRVGFLYHYFPATVFGILSIAYTARDWAGCSRQRTAIAAGYAGAALLAFVLFFPVLTGIPVSQEYLHLLGPLRSWMR